jgi:hypothetical protein
VVPAKFRASSSNAVKRTTVSYALSEPATVSFSFVGRGAGRIVKGVCRVKTAKNRKRSHCDLALQGGFSKAGAVGANSFRFSGRLRRRRLAPGSYFLVANAVDAAGNRAPATRAKFTIAKPKPPRRR